MALPAPPHAWEFGEIPRFIDDARNNEFATFANMPSEIARLSDIDVGFRKAIDGLNHSKEWFAGFFMLRAHSNFLAACRLCWSGQNPETYAVLRSCLENALYGLYLAKNPESRETWLRRQDSDEAKKKVRDEFKIGVLLKLAASINEKEGAVAKALYERTIDYGAHPNEVALTQSLKMEEGKDQINFSVSYLDANPLARDVAIKTTSQVAVCTLSLFGSVYPERFKILGLNDLLDHVRNGL